MMPSKFLLMMASSDESIIAAKPSRLKASAPRLAAAWRARRRAGETRRRVRVHEGIETTSVRRHQTTIAAPTGRANGRGGRGGRGFIYSWIIERLFSSHGSQS